MFNLIDKYIGIRLGVDLADVEPKRITIVESPRRLNREMSYGFVHVLWWVRFDDGRSVMSVPPGSKEDIARSLKEIGNDECSFTREVGAMLKASVEAQIKKVGLALVDRTLIDLVFVCDDELLRSHPLSVCQRLSDPLIPLADGIHVPTQCIVDGAAFGVVDRGVVVSAAYAHRSGVMQDRVADIGVETTAGYRRRGFAKAAVSALAGAFAARGGQARYGCSPENAASIATAVSVGFTRYAESLVLSTQRPEPAGCATEQSN